VTGGNVSLDTGSGNATAAHPGGRAVGRYRLGRRGFRDGVLTQCEDRYRLRERAADPDGKLRDLDVDTGSGDVTLNVPATLGGDIYIDTGSGASTWAGSRCK